MTGIDELRAALHEEADRADTLRPARVREVRGRVRRVRRRRTGVAALAVAAIAAGGTAGVGALLEPDRGSAPPAVDPVRTGYPTRFEDRTLLGSGVLRSGQDVARYRLDVPAGRVFVTTSCNGVEEGLWVHLEAAGLFEVHGPCQPGPAATGIGVDDLGTGALTSLPEAARDVVVRTWLTRGETGPRVEAADGWVSSAVYLMPPTERLLGVDLEPEIRHEGRRWRLESWGTAPPGQATWTSAPSGSGPHRVLVRVEPDSPSATWEITVPDVSGVGVAPGAGPVSYVDLPADAAQREVVVQVTDGGPGARIGVAYYALVE